MKGLFKKYFWQWKNMDKSHRITHKMRFYILDSRLYSLSVLHPFYIYIYEWGFFLTKSSNPVRGCQWTKHSTFNFTNLADQTNFLVVFQLIMTPPKNINLRSNQCEQLTKFSFWDQFPKYTWWREHYSVQNKLKSKWHMLPNRIFFFLSYYIYL